MYESPCPRPWTWADQISSYRFWALIGAWLCVAFNAHWLRSGLLQNLRAQYGYGDLAQALGVAMPLGIATGVVWGLLVVRRHTAQWLWAAVLLAGVLLPWLTGGINASSLPIVVLHLLAGESLSYGFMLAVTATLAGGRGGRVAFAAVLAVALLLKAVVDISAPVAFLQLNQYWPALGLQTWGLMAAGLACVLLVPLWHPRARPLFAGTPPERHRPLQPRVRHPLAAALWGALLWLGALAALGLLWHATVYRYEAALSPWWLRLALGVALLGLIGVVRWNYRIHGEISALAASPELLTPRAAAIATLLLPLGALLLPLQLAQVLNHSGRTRISVGWLVCWSLLLPAAAMAQVQHAANRATVAAQPDMQ